MVIAFLWTTADATAPADTVTQRSDAMVNDPDLPPIMTQDKRRCHGPGIAASLLFGGLARPPVLDSVNAMQISLSINGAREIVDVPPTTLLVEVLRDHLHLTGTHIGCDTSQCGACNVLIDGKAVKSCTVLAPQAAGTEVTTIEGLSKNGMLHPMQAAFKEAHGLQCGFCTPGMVIAGIEIARRHGSDVDEETIRHDLEGNLCRCTGYVNIVKAIRAGAAMGGGQ
jgi:carbon-monoxide dehydrogenase small subunit